MKITPLEIRQKTFEKVFRGYDKDEVDSFLNFLSQEWEKGNDDLKYLQMKLEQSEKESEKLRQVEDSLFKTLKAAEDTGASMIEQANKTAELIVKEAKMNAEALQADSKRQAKNVVESADAQAKRVMEDLREDVSALIESYETLLAQREIILKNMKNLAAETMESVQMAKDELKRIDVTAHAKAVKELNRQSSYAVASDRAYSEQKQTIVTELSPVVTVEEQAPLSEEGDLDIQLVSSEAVAEPPLERSPVENEEVQKEKPKKTITGSFFDQFD